MNSPTPTMPDLRRALQNAEALARGRDGELAPVAGVPVAAPVALPVAVRGGVRATAAALRRLCAPWPVVVVDAGDMRDETPALSSEHHHLYLGSSDGPCWQLTQDPSRAAGLFIAERGAAR